MKPICLLLLLVASSLIPCAAQDCKPPAVTARSDGANIFAPEQEMILGELVVESLADDFRILRDERLQAYIDGLGERLALRLPTTGLKYQFHIFDYPDANAFNIPGGHVFISRKMIAFARSEDELAGVIAHELGHAASHDGAIDFTASLKRSLNVKSVGDRRDIAEKFNLLIENARRTRARGNSNVEDEQLGADRVGLYAMVAAGYDPDAFASLFGRLTGLEDGDAGNWVESIFGRQRPEQKRLKEMTRLAAQLPAGCRDRRATAGDEFTRFQAATVSYRGATLPEILPGLLWRRDIGEKLRADVRRLEFSPSGKYLMARDDYGATILTRDPFAPVMQIPTRGIRDLYFVSDEREIVLRTNDQRFERWDIATRAALEIRELVPRRGCVASKLSPDGLRLACIEPVADDEYALGFAVFDIATGKPVFEDKKFLAGLFRYNNARDFDAIDINTNGTVPRSFYQIEFSPDGATVLASLVTNYNDAPPFSFNFKLKEPQIYVDIKKAERIEISDDLSRIVARPFAILDGKRIVGNPGKKIDDGGVFSFPEGKRLTRFGFSASAVKPTLNPDYVIVHPVSNAMTGLFDVAKGKVAVGFDKIDAAVSGETIAFESATGEIVLQKFSEAPGGKFAAADLARAGIPPFAVPDVRVAAVSDNFRWLALSSTTRGGIWNLETGERKFLSRAFRSALLTGEGTAVAEFTKFATEPHSVVVMKAADGGVTTLQELPNVQTRQVGRFVARVEGLDDAADRARTQRVDGDKKPNAANGELDEDESPTLDLNRADLRKGRRLEIRDMFTGAVVWNAEVRESGVYHYYDQYSGRLFEMRRRKDAATVVIATANDGSELIGKDFRFDVTVVDLYKRSVVGTVTLQSVRALNFFSKATSERDWLMTYDIDGRLLVYSISGKKLVHRFFGSNAVLSPTRDVVAVENQPGEITFYGLDDGERRGRIRINGSAAFLRFDASGNKLFVLSAGQTAYAFDVSKIVAPAS